MNPKFIASVMQAILKEQNSQSHQPQETIDFIIKERLLEVNDKPWNVALTDKGREYLRENS